MTRRTTVVLAVALALAFGWTNAGAWNPFSKDDKKSEKERKERQAEVKKTIAAFKEADPDLERFFTSAAGYAVFPGIGKGGMGIGGAYGTGEVFEDGKRVGKTSVKQVTIGLQLGGQKYSELIFFKDRDALEAFKSGNFEFSAQVSAVAAAAGASKDAPYERGVAVFTLARGGLMYEASVGGQKFTYEAYGKE